MNNSICVVFTDLSDLFDTILRKCSSITITLRFETVKPLLPLLRLKLS